MTDTHNAEQETTDTESADTETEVESQDDTSKETEHQKTAEEKKAELKTAWLTNIREGKKTFDDMGKDLDWLKPEIQKELKVEPKKEKEPDDIDKRVQNALQQERVKDDVAYLTAYLEEADLSAETMADIKDDFNNLKNEGATIRTALKTAMRLNGIKDTDSIIAERRKKGILMPPQGTRKRNVLKPKDGLTDVEKKFMSNLPPGFQS